MITDKPLAVSEDAKGTLYLSVLPPVEGAEAANPVYAIHQNSESMACPDDQCKSMRFRYKRSKANSFLHERRYISVESGRIWGE